MLLPAVEAIISFYYNFHMFYSNQFTSSVHSFLPICLLRYSKLISNYYCFIVYLVINCQFIIVRITNTNLVEFAFIVETAYYCYYKKDTSGLVVSEYLNKCHFRFNCFLGSRVITVDDL